ncbi:MAG: BlaI/MecI/CopY family transcriptional regulator [Thermoproteota archaeon]
MARNTLRISQYDTRKKELKAFLGPLETSIVEIIWSSEKPLTVREVYEKLRKKVAYTTIMTTMNRLYSKGILNRRTEKGRGGAFYVYWPKFEKNSFKKSAVQKVLDSLLENFGDIVANYLVEKIASNEQELKGLRERLEKALKK